MLRLGRELGIGVVATNDAHYLRREDAEAHDVLLAIGTGADLDDPKRFRFTGQESYVKSEAEMRRSSPGSRGDRQYRRRWPTLCEFDFEKRYFLPSFPRPRNTPSEKHCSSTCATRAPARVTATRCLPTSSERLDYELGVITTAGYAGYFLIVEDFIARRARSRHSGRAGPRLGGRLPRRLRAPDHRRRPAPVRPAVRALPESRAGVDARHRRRLLLRAPRARSSSTCASATGATAWARSSPSGP